MRVAVDKTWHEHAPLCFEDFCPDGGFYSGAYGRDFIRGDQYIPLRNDAKFA